MAGNDTPLMKQFWENKSAHPDKILFFRMGDFYEMFHDDAVLAAPILGIALTSRNKNKGDSTPMCGFPHHSVAGPINKLLSEGHKVAICDQLEDPKDAKGIVKRGVTRILSPGMVYDSETLEGDLPNYICSFDAEVMAVMDTTSGETFYYEVKQADGRRSLLEILQPVELVLTEQQKEAVLKQKTSLLGPVLTVHESKTEGIETERLAKNKKSGAILRLISYAKYMQGDTLLKTLKPFVRREHAQRLELSQTTIEQLELFKTYRGEKKGSLFHAINRTKTSAGARKLRNFMSFPLIEKSAIEERLETVEYWKKSSSLKPLREALGGMGDLERRLGKISSPTCHPRDLLALLQSLDSGLQVNQFIYERVDFQKEESNISQLTQKIEATLVEEPPANLSEGRFIRKGVSKELDEYIELSENGKVALLELEERERNATGISTLKIRYNKVFGYYIEVTNTHKDKVPGHYLRKQTLVNAERFLTDELQELERKLLSARSKRATLEHEILNALRMEVLELSPEISYFAEVWSEVDVLSSFAWTAVEMNYARPKIVKERGLSIDASRHPVIEVESAKSFVANNIRLGRGESLLLTGPNMAGKSTIMRQAALTVVMAQMGSFVPAKSCEVGIFNRIFTRIGANDFLSEGLSTFMVEMTEASEILNQATDRSLVILDEIGRGTSTYDGMSLAQAMLEHLSDKIQATTLFATHYHELTSLGDDQGIHNAHMGIEERDGDIKFLYTLMKGPANRSYGIEVARIAGLPNPVIQRAKRLLTSREEKKTDQMDLFSVGMIPSNIVEPEAPSALNSMNEILKQLETLNLGETTPIEALNRLADIQNELKNQNL